MSEFNDLLTQWRRHLHQNPELALKESKTAAFVAARLREMGLEVCEGVGGTGVVATLTAGKGGKTIGLRADMDAIVLEETTGLPYRSQNPGVMHGCGHDGHTATLLGAAKLLSENPSFNGTVRFIFQPGEEPGVGARAMIEDGLFQRFPMDEMYGAHNNPSAPFRTLATRAGALASSEDNFVITITGKGGHASAPQAVIDPLMPAAQIVLALQTIVSRSVSPTSIAVVSCTELITDGARNAIPTTVVIKGDARSYDRTVQQMIEVRMRRICENICAAHGAACEVSYTHEFAVTVNAPEPTKIVEEAANTFFGKENVNADCAPGGGSEDMGLFLEQVPDCYFNLGTGEGDLSKNPPLHNAQYDFNDHALEFGAEFFVALVRHRLA